MASPIPVVFAAGSEGAWRVERIVAVAGETLPAAERLAMLDGGVVAGARWTLRGTTGHHRYTTRAEKTELVSRQAGLGRREATHAALIPIRKSDAWWDLAQDERRRIFEESSRQDRKSVV